MEDEVFLLECENLIKKLLDILEVELEELTEQEKELIIAYSFGMISVMGEENKISQEMKYSVVNKVIKKVFKYNEKETKNILNKLVDGIGEDRNGVFCIMIHQGKFIYPKYKANNYNEIYDKLTNMIDVIVSGEYKNY